MEKNHVDQIAAEAAEMIRSLKYPNLKGIILAAIEKAYCLGVDEMTKAGIEAALVPRSTRSTGERAKPIGRRNKRLSR